MIWLTWRQFRTQAPRSSPLLAAFAAALRCTGLAAATLDRRQR